ncbi:FAD binding domain-containing protein [Pseudoduganella violaceinigra]|uniref:FAD binding domain-containing protein n=1 Tax=Pseudoduganella violaceinigra TaxID=246602 RepID=UPI0004166CE1|nr:xanthine dehydrogenase family protein subunit M [Pseudoduganella violaceinigra]
MQSIFYERARDAADAVRLAQQDGARFIGGGTNLLDLMKGDVEHPLQLVDINDAGLGHIEELPGGGLRIGATVRNADAARHGLVRERYPLLSQAILSGASAQLRNMATMGGNLMQRTRCPYFTDTAFSHCNKRAPGSGCDARQGYQRMHAILGASPACVAVNPSDMSVALAALDALVLLRGAQGERTVAIGDFHRLPGDTPQYDTVLQPGELIVAIDLPPSRMARHSHYLKLRDRASYAFALVSVAAALEMDGATVREARIALGGVAHKPWRRRAAELLLQGRQLDDEQCRAAARSLLEGAQPLDGNRFKVELAQRAIVRALRIAGEGV